MSFRRKLANSHSVSPMTFTFTPDVTSATNGGLWERGEEEAVDEEEFEQDEEEVWDHYKRFTEVGVSPTVAPCSSPVNVHILPSITTPTPSRRPSPLRNVHSVTKRAAGTVLRDLDPRVKFYVTAANASEYVASGKVFLRSATPVWNRALLSRGNSSAGRRKGSEHSHPRGKDEDGVKLNLEVMKIQSQNQEETTHDGLSPFALDLIKDHVPGVDITVVPTGFNDGNNNGNATSAVTPVSQDYHDSERPRGRSSNYGSASRRLGFSPGAGETSGKDVEAAERSENYPAHPFLRMYQTRPGAFARLLSRDADPRMIKIAPGSTIASLMVPHPVVTGTADGEGEGEEGEEIFQGVQGTTIDMKNKKRRKKHRPRYILPPLRFLNMDWPERYLRRPTLSPRRKKTTPQRQDNDDKSSDENNTEDKSPNDDDGSGKAAPVPRAGLHVLSDFPKQFVLSSRQEEGAIAILDLDRSLSENDAIHWVPRPSRDICSELRKIAKEVESFEDMDYMLPGHLEDLLREEGVEERVVDSTVALGKVWHDRAEFLNYIYHIRRRKYLNRPSRYSSLPPIAKGQGKSKDPPSPGPPLPPLSSDVDARREWRANRSRPWEIQDLAGHPDSVPDIAEVTVKVTEEVKVKTKAEAADCKLRSDLERYRTEVDRLRWEAEKVQEEASLQPEFVPPRLVLISSKVSRCYSMSKAIRKGDTSILYIVYDFDTCTFAELLDIARTALERYSPGCKAKSALFMCQGAEGCLYMFHKIVLTPQKMKRVQYQQIKEFWKSLGELMTKVEHEDTAVHLLGGHLDTPQGKALVYEIQKAILPNMVTVKWVEENSDAGREVIEHYFDFRKFILWRAKHDSKNTLDYTDIIRSWSSLADEADEMDNRTLID